MFPKINREMEAKQTITTSVHCELTILVYMMTSSVNFIKIGVSKHCCWLCEQYMNAFQELNKNQRRTIVSGFQGKIHSGWLLPPGTPLTIQLGVQEVLEKEVNEIRAKIRAKRRSDSFPAEDVSTNVERKFGEKEENEFLKLMYNT